MTVRSSGRSRKSPVGQMPPSCNGLSGAMRLPSSPELRSEPRTPSPRTIRATVSDGITSAAREAGQEQRPTPLASPDERPGGKRERRKEPGGGTDAQHSDERRGGDGERQHREPAAVGGEERAAQGRDERDEERGGDLLHAAPQRIAVEQRRL